MKSNYLNPFSLYDFSGEAQKSFLDFYNPYKPTK
jgi:hypothetical protein